MLKLCVTPLVLAVVAVSAPAQNYVDFFNYPAGTVVPGFTEQRGDWMCTGSMVSAQAGVTFQELTLDGVNDTDACAEILAVYNSSAPGLQYAGPIVRYSGSGSTATYFMIKVQDNGSPYTGLGTTSTSTSATALHSPPC